MYVVEVRRHQEFLYNLAASLSADGVVQGWWRAAQPGGQTINVEECGSGTAAVDAEVVSSEEVCDECLTLHAKVE